MTMTDIYIIGYPKCGSTWLARLLGDALNCPVGANYKPASHKAIATEGEDRPGNFFVGQGHQMPVSRYGKGDPVLSPLEIDLGAISSQRIIKIFRDPRDVCVSAMHHWGIETIHETIEKVACGEYPLHHGGGLENFYRTWLNIEGDYLTCTTYELLHAYTRQAIVMTLAAIGITGNGVDIIGAVKRQSFEQRKVWTEEHGGTLNYGKAWQLRFLRKGIVGDWYNHMDHRAIEMCQEYFGELMAQMGYEV